MQKQKENPIFGAVRRKGSFFGVPSDKAKVLADKQMYNDALFESISKFDCEGIKSGLLRGADISVLGPEKETVLIVACYTGDLELAKEAIAKGNPINHTCNGDKFTALMYAAQKGHYDLVKLLIDSNADVNFLNKMNKGALRFAALNSHAAIVELLAKSGANVNEQCIDGETALMLAAGNKDYQMVELLLVLGADPNIKNSSGSTAALYALDEDTKITELLTRYGSK